MSFNIESFRANGLNQGGARPTQFEVILYPPFPTTQSARTRFLVQSASLPGFTVNPVQVPYYGGIVKYSGERSYDNWDVVVQNDEDFGQRALFEKWSNLMNTLVSNRLDPVAWPTGYKAAAEVIQKGKDGRDLRTYRFVGLWPIVVSPISLDWSAQGQFETFNVTFSLDYFEPVAQNSSPDQYQPILQDEPNQGNISGAPGTVLNG